MAFHLIKSLRAYFRANLVENPVARLTWGVEPRNPLRRRRALLTAALPLLLWVGLILSAHLWFASEGATSFQEFSSNLGWMVENYLLYPVSLATPFTISPYVDSWPYVILFWATVSPGMRTRFFRDGGELRTAGCTGDQIVWGIASPLIAGFCLVQILQVMRGLYIALDIVRTIDEGPDVGYFIVMFKMHASHFESSCLGVAMGFALLFRIQSLPLRLCVVFASLLLSPWAIMEWTGFKFADFVGFSSYWVYNEVPDVLSLPLRAMLVVWLWRKQCKWIEEVDL